MSETNQNPKILNKRVGLLTNAAAWVSVIVPVYNCAELIAETLDSAFQQTFKNYEIILVNDGSPDTEKLEKVLENYFDKIIYIQQKNMGAAAARNTAIENARGEFLAFLDGDDLWLPEYLEAQLKAIAEKNCDLIYANALLFGNVDDKSETYMLKAPSNGAVTTESLLSGRCNFLTSGTVVRREIVLAAGMFDELMPRIVSEDFDLWFRILKLGARVDYQKKVLLKYRVSPTGLSGDNIHRVERTISVFKTLERKYELTSAEKENLQTQLNLAKANLEIEKGKYNLMLENFIEARANFRRANKHYRKFKYSALDSLLLINPKLVLKLFKKSRPAEASLISLNNAPK
ncbi:MAG: glycosyltransferase family 2 protein [Acidobacteria bacterium]|nr:glycosyltransferase family 2 protein [Acidobacteriota bacterium]